ncbi:hypothetical protein SDC9_97245 [bioreactor metagenome]|uniref:Uncharacterized protein n=1 Tax=bioreactor metagenome TaxID=1076179 RepID=A0A645AI17_9ZZZZ
MQQGTDSSFRIASFQLFADFIGNIGNALNMLYTINVTVLGILFQTLKFICFKVGVYAIEIAFVTVFIQII